MEICLEPFFFSFSVDSFSGSDGMDMMVIWQQLNFFSFPLPREVGKITGITSLGAYQIHRLTWITQKLQPETCLFPIVKREKGLSVKPTLHVVHSLHLQGAQEDGGGAPGVQGGGGGAQGAQGGGGYCSIFVATAIFFQHDRRLE